MPPNIALTHIPEHFTIPMTNGLNNTDDTLMFDETGSGSSTEAFEPQGLALIPPQSGTGTFIERWGGSYTTMEDLVWAMQTENTNLPEYQPHLHYSEESSLRGALLHSGSLRDVCHEKSMRA